MNRLAAKFIEPYAVSVIEEPLPAPLPDQVLVKTLVSAISPGTELLVYRGQWPQDLPVDETIPALAGKFSYPLKYGYSCVGKVVGTGTNVDPKWLGRTVFSFNPHESHFAASIDSIVPLPETMSPEEAAFLPNMETAVSFLMDGRPRIGELVAVFGQGVVGLLTTALLARFPLGCLITLDTFAARREMSCALGATASLDPSAPDTIQALKSLLELNGSFQGSDLTYELSGNPAALDQAISITGFAGRIVVGSWYGEKRAPIDLGGRFHRGRIRIVSSQVSTLEPELTGRWTKQRRLQLALDMLQRIPVTQLITHRFDILRAAEAYSTLDRCADQAVQVMLTYGDLELPSWTRGPGIVEQDHSVRGGCSMGERDSVSFYTVAVQRDFVARHFLFGGDWGPENQVHSHHYKVEVQLQGDRLDQHGYLVDIVDVESRMDGLVAYYRDKTLNELPEFSGLNPSIEHLSRLFCDAMAARIDAPNIQTVIVKIWENDIAWAAFRRTRQ